MKLSVISIAQSFIPPHYQNLGWKLDPKLNLLFHQELSRIEWEKSSSRQWSQMFRHSRKTNFCLIFYDWVPVFQDCKTAIPIFSPKLYTGRRRHSPSLNLNGQHLQISST